MPVQRDIRSNDISSDMERDKERETRERDKRIEMVRNSDGWRDIGKRELQGHR